MSNIIYDYIIIGGGISGLYSAYKIKEWSPNSTFLILEKNKKIGGRLGNYTFYGVNVVTGAGIGRKKKDKLLLELVNKLGIKTHEFNINYNYSDKIDNKVDILNIISILKKKYNGEVESFKNFATKILGEELYNNFLISSGYSDYENSDIYDVLYYYGMDDNKCCSTGISIPWKELINKLAIIVGLKNIKKSMDVVNIEHENEHENDHKYKDNKYQIITKNNNKFYSKKIIIASTINTIKSLLPIYNIYNDIHSQHFIRIYGKFDKKSSIIIKEYVNKNTIVPTILQKIIPIDQDKGVYMISYSDNKNATKLNKISDNNEFNRDKLCKIIEKSLGIKKDSLKLIGIKSFYWDIGTHYYLPLKNIYKNRADFINKVQHPEKDILVVGEAVAFNQGWTEGALESIENTLPIFI